MPDRPPLHRRPAPGAPKREKTAERGYGARWRKARASFLAAHPVCAECERHGMTTPATLVDHVIPHRGDPALFWDSAGNWQSLCDTCHGAKTGRGQ